MHPYIIVNLKKNEVTGIIGDTWTILEETLKFKSVFTAYQNTSARKVPLSQIFKISLERSNGIFFSHGVSFILNIVFYF